MSLSTDGDRYAAHVESLDVGEARCVFALNLQHPRFEPMFEDLGRSRRVNRGASSPVLVAAESLGKELFEAAFSGPVRSMFDKALGHAAGRNQVLRIRLKFADVPDLMDLPWELLREDGGAGYLALNKKIALVRHLPVAQRVQPLEAASPLRILAVVSVPSDRKELPSAEHEWLQLRQSLDVLRQEGTVLVERAAGNFVALKAALKAFAPHVLHFIGHGDFSGGNGRLLLMNEEGRSVPISAEQWATLLGDCDSLRLVVINACEGGRTSRTDPFAGVAHALLARGTPAVVAMQFPVSDEGAAVFAVEFYRSIAAAEPVDMAIGAARRELASASEEADCEWATPVLYVRGDTRLFATRDEVAEGRRVLVASVVAAGAALTGSTAWTILGPSPDGPGGVVVAAAPPPPPAPAPTVERARRVGLAIYPWTTYLNEEKNLSQFKYRLLALGDSWFGIGSLGPSGTNLLLEIALESTAVAVNMSPVGFGISLDGLIKRKDVIAAVKGKRWDVIAVSVGLTELLAAVGASPQKPPGARLLLNRDEASPAVSPALRYVSESGCNALASSLAARFDELAMLIDGGLSKGIPVVIHTYDYVTPRNSPAGLAGPWMSPVLQGYGVPTDHWNAVADTLIDRLADAVESMAKRRPNTHVIETRRTLIRAAAGAPGVSGDWLNEIHPTAQGYRKLSAVHSVWIDRLLK